VTIWRVFFSLHMTKWFISLLVKNYVETYNYGYKFVNGWNSNHSRVPPVINHSFDSYNSSYSLYIQLMPPTIHCSRWKIGSKLHHIVLPYTPNPMCLWQCTLNYIMSIRVCVSIPWISHGYLREKKRKKALVPLVFNNIEKYICCLIVGILFKTHHVNNISIWHFEL